MITREEHQRELALDETATEKHCENCGWFLKVDHGIIRMTENSGVTWWQCPNPDCEKRFKEEYTIEWELDRKTTVSMEDVTR